MRKLTDREKVEQVFVAATEADARLLLDLAGVIVRSRFPQKEAAKRVRKPPKAVQLTELAK